MFNAKTQYFNRLMFNGYVGLPEDKPWWNDHISKAGSFHHFSMFSRGKFLSISLPHQLSLAQHWFGKIMFFACSPVLVVWVIWLVVCLPLWKMNSSLGFLLPHWMDKSSSHVPITTKQFYYVLLYFSCAWCCLSRSLSGSSVGNQIINHANDKSWPK